MGMADVTADHGLFSANFTNHGHGLFSVISIYLYHNRLFVSKYKQNFILYPKNQPV